MIVPTLELDVMSIDWVVAYLGQLLGYCEFCVVNVIRSDNRPLI